MGMRPREAAATEEFLASLEFYPVTREIAAYAGEIYRTWRQAGVTLSLPDVTVAAVAIRNNPLLATHNPKHFPLPELRLAQL